MVSATMEAVGDSVVPTTSSRPTASVTFAPWRVAPASPRIPTKKPARITEMALAPTAGANGVDPEEPAPMAHAIKRLAPPATRNVASVPASMWRGYETGVDKLRRTDPATRNGFTGGRHSDGVSSADDAYRTLAGPEESRVSVQGSEFVGRAVPVEDVAAAEAFRESVAAEFPDATHHVPAYRVRADPFRASADDDGEPAGRDRKSVV